MSKAPDAATGPPASSPGKLSAFTSKVGDSKGWKQSKKGFDWLWTKAQPVGEWANRQTGKLGAENWYPSTIDNECNKAARILWTFSKRSLRGDAPETNDIHAKRKDQRVLKTIPPKVIQDAQGLAIITIFRTGLGWSASSGSGLVIARDTPTSWGPPSGVLVHTIGFGFVAGIDVYDAVLVLRTQKAVDAFTNPKVSLGADIAVVAGPVGSGFDLDIDHRATPVFAYMKSKGIYGGAQVTGTVVIERQDENAIFYGRKISAKEILTGGQVAVPEAVQVLHTVIAAAEGRPFEPADLPDDIDVAPSDMSEGVETEAQLAAADADAAAATASTSTSGPAPAATRKVPPMPVPRSPKEVPDPDHESEQIIRSPSKAGSAEDALAGSRPVPPPPPPVRPPRRGLVPASPMPDGSPRESPRASFEQPNASAQPAPAQPDASLV